MYKNVKVSFYYFFFISIVFLFLMFCTEELKMGNVSGFSRFIFHDGVYIYLALIIVINAFIEAKHVTKRISLIMLVKFSREEVILVNNKKITHV